MNKQSTRKPMVAAAVFTMNDHGYAWVGHAMKLDAWEKEPIAGAARPGSADWNAAAFAACLKAYERLRQRLPSVDMALTAIDPPAGDALPVAEIAGASMATLRKLIPEMLPPVTPMPKQQE